MPFIIVVIGVLLLLLLITKFKMNAFISLLITSFVVALLLGMPLDQIVATIESGIGGTLGTIAIIFGLGAMLGRIIADAGGAYRIAITFINKFGHKRIQWAIVTASFIIGIALFFEVGLVLIVPIVFSIVRELRISPMYLGIPMAAALITTHAFLPPHPGPTAVATQYGADLGVVLLYGIIVAIPAVWLSGPVFTKFAKKIVPSAFTKEVNITALGDKKEFKLEETPGFGLSLIAAIFPVILMMISTIIKMIQETVDINDNIIFKIIHFIGTPSTAMLISLIFAIYFMGITRGTSMKEIMSSCSSAIAGIGMMILIIGGGGAFKQVLIDGGVGDYIAQMFEGSAISPVLFSWIVAAILRVSLGSATVAAISTSGLVIPMLAATPDVSLALVALATGAGSCFGSHVNDAGFWIVKEYFGLSVKETFGTWTILCSIASIVGLVGILILDIFV